MIISPVKSNFTTNYIINAKKSNQDENRFDKQSYVNNKNNIQYSIYENKNFGISFSGKNIEPFKLYDTEEFNDFVSKGGRITLDEYRDIKRNHPNLIKAAYQYIKDFPVQNLKQNPKDTAQLVKSTAKELDKMYGDNYIIVSIGTSPSFITEGLANMGKDVIFVPVSGVMYTKHKTKISSYFASYPKSEIVAEYINESLLKMNPKKEKQIVLMDFVSTGATIDLINQTINEYCKIPRDLIKKCSLNELIGSIPLNIKGCGAGGFLYDICHSRVEFISNTPHYVICGKSKDFDKENEKTEYESLITDEYPQSRAYQLIVMNELGL